MITMQAGVAKLSYVVDYFVPDPSNGNTPTPPAQSTPSSTSSSSSPYQPAPSSTSSPRPWVHSDNQNKPALQTRGDYPTPDPKTSPSTTAAVNDNHEETKQQSPAPTGSGPPSPSPWTSRSMWPRRNNGLVRSIFRDIEANLYRRIG